VVALQLAISGNGPARVVALRDGELSFGRVSGNDVVLPDGTVSRRHAVVRTKQQISTVVDLRSANGVFVNGALVTEPRIIWGGDRIRIGRFTLEVRDAHDFDSEEPTNPRAEPASFEPRDDTEARLLAEIDARELGGREVYADWLDDRGLTAEAAFVRAQDQLAAVRRKGDRVALHVLGNLARGSASQLDGRWRRRVSRPTIERCAAEFEFRCPKDWAELAPTGDPNVRFCGACDKPVFYAASVVDARDRAANRECVALDLGAARSERDLEAPYGRRCADCGYVAGNYIADACPRCGVELPQRVMMVGRMMMSPPR
jgi:uncharacterized protein (TIGR02996 family)